MEKNLGWKILFIIFLVVFAAWQLYPPAKTLKPGLDLAGGTSLIYEIDTQGLSPGEIKGLAQRTINVLRRRIDPTNVRNLIWRSHGNTRLEIQVPLASAKTREKRKAYDFARKELEKENTNLAKIVRCLSEDPAERSRKFEEFARGSNERLEILNNLADASDQRKALQALRDNLDKELDSAADDIHIEDFDKNRLKSLAAEWAVLDPNQLAETLQGLTNGDKKELDALRKYVNIYVKWADVVRQLTDPETGKNILYKKALEDLENINLDMAQMDAILEMHEKSSQRRHQLEELKRRFPDRAKKIDALVAAFADYRDVRGRVDDPEDVKRMLKGAGILEFRIVPKPDDEQTDRDEIAAYIETLTTKGPKEAFGNKYVWCEIENIDDWPVKTTITAKFGEKFYVLASNKDNEVMLHSAGTRKWKLKKAFPTTDNMGRRAIGFLLDEVAGNMFWNISKDNIGRQLCILLDGVAISAPNLKSAIRSSGIIEGSFSETEVADMVNKLNAGSLPARLIEPPIAEKTIGPIIGAEYRDQGIKAAVIGLIVVAVFMLVYYVGSGSIADIALFMNLLFILAIMALSKATFTLPGIAGVILTIGMSVDANVLIFERIREEQVRGSSLRIAIRNGYQRAFRTILDANITTFITALILYMVASEEIKGFAIVLMLGIVSSMFTALFVTRVIFQFLLSKRIIKDHLLMLRLVRKPQFNWMGARYIFVCISLILIVAGLFVFFNRQDKYDIEFTGGTSVQINLKEDARLTKTQVEERIHRFGEQIGNPKIAAARVYAVGTTGLQYEINTTETNKTTVNVTFARTDTQHNVDSVTAAIVKAQKQSAGELSNLRVTQNQQDPAEFTIATSQVNKTLIKRILNRAFDKEDVDISEPVVDEIVSRAIMTSFEGQLQILENLQPQIVSVEKITETVIDTNPELSDFLGGVKIVCNIQKAATAGQIMDRFADLRFKPDMRNLRWYPYEVLNTNLTPIQQNTTVKSFVYVSAVPEAGFRNLNIDEWNRFVENEKTRVTAAAKLQTSLSRVTKIDPSIGQQAKTSALIAIVLSLCAIVGYIWIRFGSFRYGIAAITALAHDVCITLGVIMVCTYIAGTAFGRTLLIGDFKINLEIIAAFLTIIGYSLNDTIVVFDRIRENRGKLTLNRKIINNSINQTLSRTILTSFTTFIVVLIMYIWGGTGLRGFTFAMLIGIIVGTYSSIAIASPILLLGSKSKKQQK